MAPIKLRESQSVARKILEHTLIFEYFQTQEYRRNIGNLLNAYSFYSSNMVERRLMVNGLSGGFTFGYQIRLCGCHAQMKDQHVAGRLFNALEYIRGLDQQSKYVFKKSSCVEKR